MSSNTCSVRSLLAWVEARDLSQARCLSRRGIFSTGRMEMKYFLIKVVQIAGMSWANNTGRE
jgi:hypothetical protein